MKTQQQKLTKPLNLISQNIIIIYYWCMFCMPELNGQISPAGPRQTCQIYTPTNNMHSRQQYLFSWSFKNYEMSCFDITDMSNIYLLGNNIFGTCMPRPTRQCYTFCGQLYILAIVEISAAVIWQTRLINVFWATRWKAMH